MLHLMKYDLKKNYLNMNVVFWPLIFPLILGTLFYVSFGTMEEADFETVSVAVVQEEELGEQDMFLTFLEEVEQSEDTQLICMEKMGEKEAKDRLRDQKISGIYYTGEEPRLTVNGTGIQESILESILENYLNGKETIERVFQKHPEGMERAVGQMNDYEMMVRQVSLGGKTTDGNAQFFYALISMACLYGCFIGLGTALCLQANLTALAARRCITPTHKLQLILSEAIVSFGIHFVNVMILLVYLKYILKMEFNGQFLQMLPVILVGCVIGVSLGIFVGSAGKLSEGIKVGIILGISMVCSFGAGLMAAQMKDIVERYCPILNRINPAALISDALYCINVYDDPIRYGRSLAILSILCVGLLTASYLMVRRERYDSI